MRPYLKLLGWLTFWMLARPQFAQQKVIDERFFAEKVYPILEKAECRMCHNDNGVSSATRLKFPPSEAKTEAIEIFGLKLSALVDRQNVTQSLLLNKPTMRIPHTGGERKHIKGVQPLGSTRLQECARLTCVEYLHLSVLHTWRFDRISDIARQ